MNCWRIYVKDMKEGVRMSVFGLWLVLGEGPARGGRASLGGGSGRGMLPADEAGLGSKLRTDAGISS